MQKIRVLMVDDEERFRTVTSKILEKKGFETIVAESGEAALKKLDPDLNVVVLDVKMAAMDGHETLQRIKEGFPDLPVIMLTGHGAMPSAEQALSEGAFDYLAKPCDIDLLATRIQDAVHFAAGGARREKNVGDIMIPLSSYARISETSALKDALAALEEAHRALQFTDRLMDTGHRSLLVFNDLGGLVGILSPRDMILAARPPYLTAAPPNMTDALQYSAMFWEGLFTTRIHEIMDMEVGQIMSDSPPTISIRSNLMEAANTMAVEGCRRIAVTDNGDVVGVIREQELFFEIATIIASG